MPDNDLSIFRKNSPLTHVFHGKWKNDETIFPRDGNKQEETFRGGILVLLSADFAGDALSDLPRPPRGRRGCR